MSRSKIPQSYKQTEIGVIPEDWEEGYLGNKAIKVGSGITPTGGEKVYKQEGRPFLRSQNIGWGTLLMDDIAFIDDKTHETFKSTEIEDGDVFLNITGASIGRSAVADSRVKGGNVNQHVCIIRTNRDQLEPRFLNYLLLSDVGQWQVDSFQAGGNRQGLNFGQIRSFRLPFPTTPEQRAIATAIFDADALIKALENLIAKKRAIKQGAMQEFLTGKRRLPGFSGKWEIKTIEEVADCLDNLRVPLNDRQRAQMQGDVPYCGANGVLDYINSHVVDDDIILIAEDGGYFDEYAYRPIAYRMIGKCWVNNHAHILKAKASFDQGFLFYTIVHKNILKFLASGTRAKLNKSEMYKIEIDMPPTEVEQSSVANTLSEIDQEVALLERKIAKYKMLKQGMMQVLLTGKVRLI